MFGATRYERMECGGLRYRNPEFLRMYYPDSGGSFALFAFPDEHRLEVWECEDADEALELLDEFREMTIIIH